MINQSAQLWWRWRQCSLMPKLRKTTNKKSVSIASVTKIKGVCVCVCVSVCVCLCV